MNDEELIDRLRRTLSERAEALEPNPGSLPAGPVAGASYTERRAAQSDPEGRAAQSDPEGRAARSDPGRRAAPSDPERRAARRRRAAAVTGAAVLAAAAAVVAIAVSGGSPQVTVGPARRGAPAPAGTTPASTGPAALTTPTTRTGPGPIVPAPPTTAVTPNTPPPPVPAGFHPYSVTFVSAERGWALGWAPCSTGDPAPAPAAECAVLASTRDGGRSWSAGGAPSMTAPSASGTYGLPPFQVRFADADNGWAWTNPSATQGSRLWATHDAGATWTEVADPAGDEDTIADVEASAGRAQLVAYGCGSTAQCASGGPGYESVFTDPDVGFDKWVPAPVRPSIGAAPVFSPQLTLWGSDGWIVNTARVVVSGARLTPGQGWSGWTPPCSNADGTGLLAAASATDVVAVCAEGVWGTPAPGTQGPHNWLFRSTDGGATFTAVGELPGDDPQSVTVAPGSGGAIVVADAQEGLLASFDGGRSWTQVQPTPGSPGAGAGAGAGAGGEVFSYVGFTTASQGVAIATKPAGTLYMTADGGHTWAPVDFQAG